MKLSVVKFPLAFIATELSADKHCPLIRTQQKQLESSLRKFRLRTAPVNEKLVMGIA